MKTTFDTLDKHVGMIGGKSKLPDYAQEALDLYQGMVNDAGEDMAQEIVKDTPEVKAVMDGLLKSVDDILNKPHNSESSNNRKSAAGKSNSSSTSTKSGSASNGSQSNPKAGSKKRAATAKANNGSKAKPKAKVAAKRKSTTTKRKTATKAKSTTPRKAPMKVTKKPKAITTRNIKTPDLTVLTRFVNLPKQRRTYKSIAGFLKQVENGLSKGIYVDHKSIIQTIASKLKKLVGIMSEDQEMNVTISDQKFMEKVQKALDTAKPRLQVNFLAGLNGVPEVDWDFLEENHPDYFGSDRIGELLDIQDYLDGEKSLKEIGFQSKKEAISEYNRLSKMVMKEAKGLNGKK